MATAERYRYSCRRFIGEINDSSEVTVFGESAGAIMTAILFLGHQIENFARAAVSILYYDADSSCNQQRVRSLNRVPQLRPLLMMRNFMRSIGKISSLVFRRVRLLPRVETLFLVCKPQALAILRKA